MGTRSHTIILALLLVGLVEGGRAEPPSASAARLALLARKARAWRYETKRRPELRKVLQEMLSLQTRMGRPKRERAETLFRMGEAAYDRYTKHRDALPHHRAALDLLDHAPALPAGRHDELRDKILHGLVACQKELGNLEACRLLHGEIVALRRRGCGAKKGKVGWSLWRLARVEEKLGRLPEALVHVKEALEILERTWTGDDGVLLQLRDHYRKLLARSGGGESWFGAAPSTREARRQEELLLKARSTPLAPGETPLHRASRYGLVEEVRRLLAAGAAVDVRDAKDRPALHHVAAKGDDPSMLAVARLLLKAGADPNSPSERHRYTPLQRAAERGNVAMCRVLLEGGARLDTRDGLSRTPIYIAGYYGRAAVVRLFIEEGADVSAVSKGGARPLHIVCSGSPFPGQDEVVDALVKAGADVNARDAGGETPLFAAVSFGRVDMAGTLLGLGADPKLRNLRGETVLTHAKRRKIAAMVELLLAHGATE